MDLCCDEASTFTYSKAVIQLVQHYRFYKMLKITDATPQNLTLTLQNLPSLLAMIHVVVIRTKMSIKLKIRY